MDGSYEVVTAALQNHAHTLDGLADELRDALGEVSGVSLPGDAYGNSGRGFAAAVQQLSTQGQDALQDGVDAFESAAETLRGNTTAYDQQEVATIDLLTSATAEHDPSPGNHWPPANDSGAMV